MRITFFFFVAIFTGLSLGLMSQPGQGRGSGGRVTGKVVDQSTGEPMEFVNVVLYRSSDSTMVTGDITSGDGIYTVAPVGPGDYYMVLNFIGFRRQVVSGVTISGEAPVYRADQVALSSDSRQLEGVEVRARDERIEYRIDRRVINVDQDLSSSGGTAVDALENTPSVEVDIEGNVSLRGSSNFTVLIDGKPTSLDGNDILRQLPASSIQQIEIITNPSVRYDPEGGSGIINVIMKKRQRTGFNGIVNGSLGNQGMYSGDFLLNYRSERANYYVGADASQRNHPMDARMERETYGDTTIFVDSDRERVFKRQRLSARAGLDFYATDRQTISFSTRVGEYLFGHDVDSRTARYTKPQTQTIYSVDESVMERTGQYVEFTGNYDFQIDGNGHKLEASGVYSYHDRASIDQQMTWVTDADFMAENSAVNEVSTSEDQISNRIRLNVDYTRPMLGGSFETGLQSRMRLEKIDYFLDVFDPTSNLVGMEQFADRKFDFNQNVHGAYMIFSRELGPVGMKAGLRGEYTDRQLINPDTAETFGIQRFDLFPSVHLSYAINKENRLMTSYSRRINRPRSWYLDPFISYRDQYTLRKGNPELEPEYTDSYEVTYLRYLSFGFVSLETFFRQTNNRIERIAQLYDQDMLVMGFHNVDRDRSLGSELMANMHLTQWLSINASGSLYQYWIFTEEKGEAVTREDLNWRVRGSANVELGETTRLQLTAFYNAPSITSTGTRGSYFMTSLALRQDFLNDQLNLVLRVRDVFMTRGRESTTIHPDYYVHMEHFSNVPMISLGVTYRINNYDRRRDRRNGAQEDEMDMGF